MALGTKPDRTPVIAFGRSEGADAVCVPVREIQRDADTAILAIVESPLARAIRHGVPLVQQLSAQDHTEFDRLKKETREEIGAATTNGADGIVYVIDGASPAHTTPMEYGGFFLETDRTLLTEIADAPFNLIYVASESDPYIDFVSDLPAHGFAWRADVGLAEVRALRSGAIMGEDFVLEHKEAVARP